MARWWPMPRLLKLCLLCALVLATCAEDEKAPSDSISWMVQLSDLHVSKYNKSPIEADMRLLADQVLSLINPAKVLLTGDLVDAKTKQGGSEQHASEWKAYEALWQYIAQATGLKAEDILDVRGNHDSFNTISTQGTDHFMAHSARAAVSQEAASARAQVQLLPPRVELPAGGGASASEGGRACPAGVLLAVQTTPVVGLKGPTNFLGVMRPEDVAEVDRQLSLAVGSLHSRGCSPPIIAYGHHPLSTIHYPGPQPPSGTLRATLKGKLASFDTAAYLCGHLHDVFGDRLHRLHYKPSGALLAELEAADWKSARAFRVLALDSGALSFADLRFVRPQGSPHGQVAPVDESLVITQHLALVTHPPPATYSPLTSLQLQQQYRAVRCLVLPMRGLHAPPPRAATGRPLPPKVASVLLNWRCGADRGAAPMQQVKEGQPVYEARELEGMLQCRGLVEMQVTVTDAQGGRSLSDVRVVQVAAQGGGFSPLADPDGDPNAGFTWLERLMLGTFWPEASGTMFATLWGTHFWGMLLLPRLFGPTLLSLLTPSRSISPLGTSPLSLLQALLLWVWGLLLWPLKVLVRLSLLRTVWAALVLFSLNLHSGPWFLGSFFAGAPLGIFTARGLYHPAPDPARPPPAATPYTFDPNPDVRISTVVHTTVCLLPITLWIAAVISRWCDHAADGPLGPPPGPLGLSWLQVVGLMPMAWLNWKMLGRLSSAYGPVALLTSPPYGLLPVLAVLLLWHARKRIAAGRVLMPCRSLPKAID